MSGLFRNQDCWFSHAGAHIRYFSLCKRKPTIWVPTRTDSNSDMQSQKQARILKFWIQEEEELYYLCSENKGTDQLRWSAPLFLHMQIVVFSCGGSFFCLIRGLRLIQNGLNMFHFLYGGLKISLWRREYGQF